VKWMNYYYLKVSVNIEKKKNLSNELILMNRVGIEEKKLGNGLTWCEMNELLLNHWITTSQLNKYWWIQLKLNRKNVEIDQFDAKIEGWTSRTGHHHHQEEEAEVISGTVGRRIRLRAVPTSVPIRSRGSSWSIATSADSASSSPETIPFSYRPFVKVSISRSSFLVSVSICLSLAAVFTFVHSALLYGVVEKIDFFLINFFIWKSFSSN